MGNESESNETWTSLLKAARELKSSHEAPHHDGKIFLLEEYAGKFESWKESITSCASFSRSRNDDSPPLTDEEKTLIVETRAALRFGLLILAIDNMTERERIQIAMVKSNWHVALANLLSQRKCDAKCRLYGNQLLSNIVTSNHDTATIISAAFPLSPSQKQVSASILHGISDDEKKNDIIDPNWVDMILSAAKSGKRESLSAIVASLHNCVASIEQDDSQSFAKEVASNSMLVSVLLRHFISAQTVTSNCVPSEQNSENPDPWDAATDFIYLLLTRLGRLELFPLIFSAVAGKSPQELISNDDARILPEQIVLLQCFVKEIESFAEAIISDSSLTHPFLKKDKQELKSGNSYDFLASLFTTYSVRSYPTSSERGSESSDAQILRSGVLSMLDILGTTLGIDDAVSKDLRQFLGTKTQLLQDSAQYLGYLVDIMTQDSFGKKARDHKVSDEDQHLITALVRLLGNMCFQCRENQDLMRTTLVPRRFTTKDMTEKDLSDGKTRNALHVLLSCTSFSTSCFTLREWGVIAIRNVLEDNIENQEVVAKLEAQSPVQSAVLDQAGVRVKLDQKGKVSLSTVEED